MVPDEKFLALAGIIALIAIVYAIGEWLLRRRKREKLETVFAANLDLTRYDDMPSGVAVLMAWSEPGDFPRYHQRMQDEVRKNMPVLARALDRLVEN
jgi:hypothetical protein